MIELEEGNYSIQLENSSEEKVLYLKKGEMKFINLDIYSMGFFQFPEFYLKEYNKEEALVFLLEGDHMNRCKNSHDQ
jgi:hypothetical protein